jgi:hypothetical protein
MTRKKTAPTPLTELELAKKRIEELEADLKHLKFEHEHAKRRRDILEEVVRILRPQPVVVPSMVPQPNYPGYPNYPTR